MKTVTQEQLRQYESEGMFIDVFAQEVPPSPEAPHHPRFELVALPALSAEQVKLATLKGEIRQVRFASIVRICKDVGRKEITVKLLDDDEAMSEDVPPKARSRAPSKKA